MQVLLWERRAGKTTACIEYLENHLDTICIVPRMDHRDNYPGELRDRVFSAGSTTWRGVPFSNAIIDDANYIKDSKLAEIISCFDIKMITLSPISIIERAIFAFGFSRKTEGEKVTDV